MILDLRQIKFQRNTAIGSVGIIYSMRDYFCDAFLHCRNSRSYNMGWVAMLLTSASCISLR